MASKSGLIASGKMLHSAESIFEDFVSAIRALEQEIPSLKFEERDGPHVDFQFRGVHYRLRVRVGLPERGQPTNSIALLSKPDHGIESFAFVHSVSIMTDPITLTRSTNPVVDVDKLYISVTPPVKSTNEDAFYFLLSGQK
jgi:hypothetical protein